MVTQEPEKMWQESETTWKNFLIYVSRKKIGDYLYRREYIKKKFKNKYHAVDSYRSLLTKIGIIEKVKAGVYVKKKNIKPSWKLNVIKEIAYKDTWKSWFYKFD
jgi:butyrate kinase